MRILQPWQILANLGAKIFKLELRSARER